MGKWYDKFYYPVYEQIKEILVDPERKENVEHLLLSQDEMVKDGLSKEGENLQGLLKLLDKPVLSDVIINCSKKAGNSDVVKFDLNMSRKKTETIIFKNILSLKSSSSNTKTTVFVDEMSSEKNNKSQNLNNSIEEFFNDDS